MWCSNSFIYSLSAQKVRQVLVSFRLLYKLPNLWSLAHQSKGVSSVFCIWGRVPETSSLSLNLDSLKRTALLTRILPIYSQYNRGSGIVVTDGWDLPADQLGTLSRNYCPCVATLGPHNICLKEYINWMWWLHECNPSTWEAEGGGLLVLGQPVSKHSAQNSHH